MNPRRLAPLVVPVVIWVMLWGEVSVANVASGLVVAVVLWLLFPPARRHGPGHPVFRPIAIARFGASFAWRFLLANIDVAREVVRSRRRSRIHTGIVAVPVRGCTDSLLTVIANTTTLTPGTMSVEASDDPQLLYVHVLSLHDVSDVLEDVARTNELVVRAFGTPAQIAALAEPPSPDPTAGSPPPAPGATEGGTAP